MIKPNPSIAPFSNPIPITLKRSPFWAHSDHQLGRPNNAAPILHRAAVADPQSPEVQYNLGLALAAQEKWPAAIAAFQKAISLRPDYASAHNALGNCLRAMGQSQHAVDAYRRAVLLKPDFAGYWNNLGIGLQSLGQTPEATDAFHRALLIKPDYFEALSNLGNVQWLTGRPHEAAETCRRAIALQPQFPGAWNNLGNSLRDCGQVAEATEAYARAIELAPRDAGFHSNLIYSLHFQPDIDPAEVFRRHVEWNTLHAAHLARMFPCIATIEIPIVPSELATSHPILPITRSPIFSKINSPFTTDRISRYSPTPTS